MKSSRSTSDKRWLSIPVAARLGIASLFGILAGFATGYYLSWTYAPLVFWDVTALIAAGGIWVSVHAMDAAHTKKHATIDDPGRGIVDMILVFASLASLAAVFVLIIHAGSASGLEKIIDIGLGVSSVVISWVLVHITYMLRYADLYYKGDGAIDFNTAAAPTYQDFAYLAFTIGMTYQVSDTSLKTTELRTIARQHAVLSYIFGTAIIATVINTLAGLAR